MKFIKKKQIVTDTMIVKKEPLPLNKLEFIVQEAKKKYKNYNFLIYQTNKAIFYNKNYGKNNTIILYNCEPIIYTIDKFDPDKFDPDPFDADTFSAYMNFKECMELVDRLVFIKKEGIKKQKREKKELKLELENWKKGEQNETI